MLEMWKNLFIYYCNCNRSKRRSGECVGLSRQRSMVRVSTATLLGGLFLIEVFGLLPVAPPMSFPWNWAAGEE